MSNSKEVGGGTPIVRWREKNFLKSGKWQKHLLIIQDYMNTTPKTARDSTETALGIFSK